MRRTLYGILLVIATLVGYRLVSDMLEEQRDFR